MDRSYQAYEGIGGNLDQMPHLEYPHLVSVLTFQPQLVVRGSLTVIADITGRDLVQLLLAYSTHAHLVSQPILEAETAVTLATESQVTNLTPA